LQWQAHSYPVTFGRSKGWAVTWCASKPGRKSKAARPFSRTLDKGRVRVDGQWPRCLAWRLADPRPGRPRLRLRKQCVWNDMFVETLVMLLAGSKAVGLWRSTAMSWLNLVLGAWLVVGSHTVRTGLRSRSGATLERHHHWPTHHVPELA
jgi:hypothetical protein